MLAFSLPLTIVHGMNFLITNVDTFMIGYYLVSSEVGIYNIAFQLRNMLNIISITFGFLLPPVLAKLHTEGHESKISELYQFVTKWIIISTFPLYVSFVFLPDIWIGTLFGNKYLPGSVPLFILGIGVLFSASVGVTGPSLVGLGRNRVIIYTTTSSVILNIIFNVLLIPKFGISGAAAASTLSIAVLEVSNAAILYKEVGIFPIKVINITLIILSGIIASGIFIFWSSAAPNLWLFISWLCVYIFGVSVVISSRDISMISKLTNLG
jgi:O-antigen/teichoic acid export membrane protein